MPIKIKRNQNIAKLLTHPSILCRLQLLKTLYPTVNDWIKIEIEFEIIRYEWLFPFHTESCFKKVNKETLAMKNYSVDTKFTRQHNLFDCQNNSLTGTCCRQHIESVVMEPNELNKIFPFFFFLFFFFTLVAKLNWEPHQFVELSLCQWVVTSVLEAGSALDQFQRQSSYSPLENEPEKKK